MIKICACTCKWGSHWCLGYVCVCIRGQDLVHAVHLKFWLSQDCRFMFEKSRDRCTWKHPRIILKGGVSLKHANVMLSSPSNTYAVSFQNTCLRLGRAEDTLIQVPTCSYWVPWQTLAFLSGYAQFQMMVLCIVGRALANCCSQLCSSKHYLYGRPHLGQDFWAEDLHSLSRGFMA